MAAFLADANTSGRLPAIAGFFNDGTALASGIDHDLLSVTLQGLGCGWSDIVLPTGATDTQVLDGRAATYGEAIEVTAEGSGVSVCGAERPPGEEAMAATGGAASVAAASPSFVSCPSPAAMKPNDIDFNGGVGLTDIGQITS